MKIQSGFFFRICLLIMTFSIPVFSGTDTLFFSIPNVNAFRGDTVRIPVTVSSLQFSDSIYSGDFVLAYDTTVIQIIKVQTDTTLLAGSSSSFNPLLKKIGFASSSPVTGSGILFKLVARLLPTATSSSPINFMSVILNEGGFNIRTTNGGINPLNRLPQFVNVLHDTSVIEKDSLTINFGAIDPDGDQIKYSLGNPIKDVPGVFFDSLTGKFAWRPNLQQGGIGYLLHVTATDDRGGFSIANINLTVKNLNQNPQINAFPDTVFRQENVPINDTIVAVDADFDQLSFSLQNAPFGMSIIPAGSNQNVFRARFLWTPGFNQAGTYPVTLIVSDNNGGVASKIIVFKIFDSNRIPIFTFPPRDTLINENTLLTMSVKAVDPDNDTVIYGLNSAPNGMTINQFGIISWIPTFLQAGIYSFEVAAGDAKGLPTKVSVTVTVNNVNRPPQFTSVLSDTLIYDTTKLSFKYSAVDADNDNLSFVLLSAPQGASLSPTGNFSFNPFPNQLGLFFVLVSVTDGISSVIDTARIFVSQANNSPIITKGLPDTTIKANTSLTFQYSAFDANISDTLTYGLFLGPQGVTVSPTGLLSWTPASFNVGQNLIIVGVTDGKGGSLDTAIVTVQNINNQPRFTNVLRDTTIKVNIPFTFQYSASDDDISDTLAFGLFAGPQGVTVSPKGFLSWTPQSFNIGQNLIIVGVTDGKSGTLDTVIVTVQNINRPPQFISTLPDLLVPVDAPLNFKYTAVDPDNDNLIFSFVKFPLGAVLQPDGVFSWKPSISQIGKDTIIAAVSDGLFIVVDTAIITVNGSPTMQFSQNNFDFGSISFGSTKTVTTTITNIGTIPLTLIALPEFNVPSNPNFFLDTAGISFISPGGVKTISVTYNPKSVGGHSTVYTFVTNDPKNSSFVLNVNGSAIAKLVVTKRLLVDTLHNSRLAFTDSTSGVYKLFNFFEQSGIQISLTGAVLSPSGNDILLMIAPQKNFSRQEIDSVKKFVTNGGLLVALGNSAIEGNNAAALNSLLKDTSWTTNLSLDSNLVVDSTNFFFDAASPLLTTFADAKHPYFANVDTLVFFSSASVTVSGSAIPLITTTANGKTIGQKITSQPVVAGLSKIGKGKILLLGDADVWKVESQNKQSPPNISMKDNLAFAINVFSVTEDYEVSLPAKTPNEKYQLVSIPYDLQNSDVASVLKGLGDPNPLVWRLFGRYDPAALKYAEFPSDKFKSFKRGEAYWLITRGEFGLSLGNSTIVPVQSFYPIKIGPGYSMVGNPFPYKVSWSNSIHDSVQTFIWKFNGDKFVPESLSMEPFIGYFVKNLSKDSVTIFINPEDITNFKKSGTIAAVYNEEEWRVQIGAVSGKSADDENYAGVAHRAKDEFDMYDVAEPPPSPTDYVVVRFQNNSWKEQSGSYAMDIRSINSEGLFWDFDVITSKSQSHVALNLTQLGNIPNDFVLYVVDKTTERVMQLDQTYQYEFTMAKNESRRNFRLIAGKKEYIEKNTQGIPLIAVNYSLMQNYPNPFNPSTQIRYALGHSGQVSLDVYNVLGQHIRTLAKGVQQIGTYDVEWDGKDNGGAIVSTGVYFYTIKVVANGEKIFTETKKLMFLK